jgi:hypothetical protein
LVKFATCPSGIPRYERRWQIKFDAEQAAGKVRDLRRPTGDHHSPQTPRNIARHPTTERIQRVCGRGKTTSPSLLSTSNPKESARVFSGIMSVPTARIAFLYEGMPRRSAAPSSSSSRQLLRSGCVVCHHKRPPTLSTRFICQIASVEEHLSRQTISTASWRWRMTIHCG